MIDDARWTRAALLGIGSFAVIVRASADRSRSHGCAGSGTDPRRARRGARDVPCVSR